MRPKASGLRLHQSIARQIGIAILSGRYRTGEAIGGEIEQSIALGVSRTPYREAIRILVAKGLLESRPKTGTRITSREQWNLLDADVLAWMFAGTPDPLFVRDLFELRGVIEPAAAGFAARRRTSANMRAMRTALDEMDRHGLAGAEGQNADRRFHHAILEAAGNQALASLSSSIEAAVQWTTDFKQRRTEGPRDPLPEHETLYAAIAASAPKRAEAAMIDLLALALADLELVLGLRSQATER